MAQHRDALDLARRLAAGESVYAEFIAVLCDKHRQQHPTYSQTVQEIDEQREHMASWKGVLTGMACDLFGMRNPDVERVHALLDARDDALREIGHVLAVEANQLSRFAYREKFGLRDDDSGYGRTRDRAYGFHRDMD